MSSLAILLSILGGFFAITGIAAGVVGFFRASKAQTIIGLQKTAIETLDKLLGVQKIEFRAELDAYVTKFEGCETRLQQTENVIAILSNQVSSKDVAELTKLIILHQKQILNKLARAEIRIKR